MIKEEVIQAFLNQIHGNTYLEIGVASGGSFWAVKAKHKIGIDPGLRIKFNKRVRKKIAEIFNFRYERLYRWTSDEYFANNSAISFLSKHKIDVAFIDGLHTYEQSLKDVLNCLNYLHPSGVIILHDCNPESKSSGFFIPPKNVKGETDELHSNWSGEVWKTIVDLRSCRKDLNIFVLDCDHGVGVITFGKPENRLAYSQEKIAKMTYEEFFKSRNELLNLKNPDFLYNFLSRKNP